MLAKRIIPCLDVRNGQVVKGLQFKNLQTVGDPVTIAQSYEDQNADEVSLLDISASRENREVLYDLIGQVADTLYIPLSVGGGIRTISDIQQILSAGAEKVSIGTSAVLNPQLIEEGSKQFGAQAIVVSLDVKKNALYPSGYELFIYGGSQSAEQDALNFAKIVQDLGCGEILLNSIDADGTKTGFDISLNRLFTENLRIPIIASGGAGTMEDFLDVLQNGKADAALAASVFHYRQITIPDLKTYLKKNGVEVRL